MSHALTTTTPGAAVQMPADVMALGQTLAKSGYFKDARDASQAVVKVLYGQEIGIGPVTAMMGIHIIEGKPALSANLVAARIKASGRYDYRVREQSGEVCKIEFFERNFATAGLAPIGVVEWSMEDARRAGLGGRGPWKSYPRAMLFARAITEGARTHCPEVFGGVAIYTPDELGAEVDGDGYAITATEPALSPTGDNLTPDQLDLITKLQASHVITDRERAGIGARIAAGMTKQKAKECIDWLLAEVKARKAMEEAEAEHAAAGFGEAHEPEEVAA